MHRRNLRWAARVAGLVLALVLPSAAQAASAPTVTTGGVSNLTFDSVRLSGTVDPNGAETSWQFQYGTTSKYGSTAPVTAGTVTGDGKKTVTVDITGLAPFTVYHYKLIATNSAGKGSGSDRTFKTKKQPLGVTLTATPNPVPYGQTTTLGGQLTGTDNSGRQILLQNNPFPYLQGFKQVESPVVTDKDGNFTFGLQAAAVNTQFRVQLPDKPSVVSPIVVVSVQPVVSTHVATTRVRKGGRLTFSGTFRPGGLAGTPIAIQKRRNGRWITVAGAAATRGKSPATTAFSKKVRIPRGGTYRVYVGVNNGQLVPAVGRSITIHTHH